MTDYDNSNRISLWFNDKREKQTQPHIKGQGETTIPVWASAWFTQDLNPEDAKTLMEIIRRHAGNSKKPFLTISLTPKEEKLSDSPMTQSSTMPNDDFDDDIPFS